MKHKKKIFALLLLGISMLLGACASTPDATPCPECPEVECPEMECPELECPEVDCPECPEMEPCPEALVDPVPYEEQWLGSGHADMEAEAFRHWDEDDPAVVPIACAKCHSSTGYLDFLGVDGSEAGVVDADHEIGTTVECATCHNSGTAVKDSVMMPSGIELTGLGDEARCMECHQGRNSTVGVDAAIEGVGLTESPDTISEELRFANIHYYPAAATKYGTFAKGGYEYAGKTYDSNFAHVEGYDTCIGCHDSHTLEVKADACVSCHGEGEFADYRMLGSLVDYDGDDDLEEGIAYEIAGLQEVLYSAIQVYAADTTGTAIVYDSSSYPYFFADADGDGAVTGDEGGFSSWTPRLLRAAYNYQLSVKDPGAFAHGGKYIIQLLYDSIEDLNPEAVAGLHRIDHGHFAGSEEAFRHWDEDGEVEADCAKCHSATGLPTFHKEGVNISAELANGFQCETCHGGEEWPARFEFASVTFPSGKTVDSGDPTTNLCMNCHQGRESGASVNRTVAGIEPDTVMEGVRFLNVHYFAAGATRYGTEAMGGYEYEGKSYVGAFAHVPGYDTCASCHDAHALEVQTEQCFTCHAGVESVEDIRMSAVDFDGDGDATEGIAGEIETMNDLLYEAIVAYPAQFEEVADIQYLGNYPYWGTSEGERYVTFTPRLLEAAYNYQYAHKDPGAFAHNALYIIQLLYDSIEDIGGDVSGMTRPEVPAASE